MSHQPKVISDPFEFARRGDSLAGEVEVQGFSRLAEAVLSTPGAQCVAYVLTGARQDDKSFLRVQARADLVMRCQRCLGDVNCVVEADTRLLLVSSGEPLPDDALEEDDFDPVHAWRDFDVLGAVEEELLLALPLAPTHEDCSVPVAGKNGDDGSPFAILRSFKASGKRET